MRMTQSVSAKVKEAFDEATKTPKQKAITTLKVLGLVGFAAFAYTTGPGPTGIVAMMSAVVRGMYLKAREGSDGPFMKSAYIGIGMGVGTIALLVGQMYVGAEESAIEKKHISTMVAQATKEGASLADGATKSFQQSTTGKVWEYKQWYPHQKNFQTSLKIRKEGDGYTAAFDGDLPGRFNKDKGHYLTKDGTIYVDNFQKDSLVVNGRVYRALEMK